MRKNVEIKGLIIKETKERIRKNPKLTIKEIADACFVNIAAVNYHFGSKDNLIAIVVKEIIDELKEEIYRTFANLTDDSEKNLETLINVILHFSINNSGVIQYLFLHNESLDRAAHLLLDAFFTDNSFTKKIVEEIQKVCQCEEEVVTKAKYMLLFFCFTIPLFLQASEKFETKPYFPSFQDPAFVQAYVKEVLKIIR